MSRGLLVISAICYLLSDILFDHAYSLCYTRVCFEKCVPVAQWIEQRPPEPCAHVRVVSGTFGSQAKTETGKQDRNPCFPVPLLALDRYDL